MADPHWDHIRYCVILADMRHIAGDAKLTERIQRYFYYKTTTLPFIQWMLNNTLHLKVSVNVLGRLITQLSGDGANAVDVKYGGYLGLVKNVRIWAIAHGVRDTSTWERIERIGEAANC